MRPGSFSPIGAEMKLQEIYQSEKRIALRAMLGAAVLSIVASLGLLTVPLYLSQVYTRVLSSRSIETLIALSIIAIVVLITHGLLETIRNNLLSRIGVRFEARISGLLLAGELAMPQGSSSASLYQLAEIRKLISSNVFPSLFDLPVMFIFLLLVFTINTILGSVVLVGMVVLFLTAVLNELLTSSQIRESDEASASARKVLTNQFEQQELVRALGLYPQAVNQWGKIQNRFLTQLIAVLDRSNALSSLSKEIRQIIQIVMIGSGALLVIDGLASIIASRALAPIEAIVSGWRILKQGRIALAKLEERLTRFKLVDGVTQLPRPTKSLVTDRVVFVPGPNQQPILKGITGSFGPGQNVAIIGPSGAGKSTFARLVVGYLEPTGGQVKLDGQDIRSWDPVTRGAYMGYMPQQVRFFEGTIRENIARMRVDDPPELAIEAAQFVGVHDMIMQFPQGYDTLISDSGFQPSGGQKQLLGLARAYYGMPAFVVLDEPNASLDTEGEALLFDLLKRAGGAGIATIVVTQRLSLLHHVDKVLVLKNGLADAYGSPADVMPNQVRAVPNKAS
jgi:PrtD family type I secretion system ABC transporter